MLRNLRLEASAARDEWRKAKYAAKDAKAVMDHFLGANSKASRREWEAKVAVARSLRYRKRELERIFDAHIDRAGKLMAERKGKGH
jgi:hypothetical protein